MKVLAALWAALKVDPQLFVRIGDTPLDMLLPALGVALLAAASTMLGHVAILRLNRINGWRLLTSLLLSVTTIAVLHVVQAAIVWAVASLVGGGELPLIPLIVVGLISTAPLTLNFTTALPHFGLMIGRGLQIWGFLILCFGLYGAFQVPFWWAVGFCFAGWLTMQLLARAGRRPLTWLASRVWTLATGTPTMVTASDILAGTPVTPVARPGEVRK